VIVEYISRVKFKTLATLANK